MTVWVVITEWNRPHDTEGGFTLEGVAGSDTEAGRIRDQAITQYREFGHTEFYDPATDTTHDDWDFDVHVEACEVSGMPAAQLPPEPPQPPPARVVEPISTPAAIPTPARSPGAKRGRRS